MRVKFQCSSVNVPETLVLYRKTASGSKGQGGWHDFRHTPSTAMRRNKVHPKVISETLGHVKVPFAPEIYDHASVEEMREPLAAIASQLLPTVTNDESTT